MTHLLRLLMLLTCPGLTRYPTLVQHIPTFHQTGDQDPPWLREEAARNQCATSLAVLALQNQAKNTPVICENRPGTRIKRQEGVQNDKRAYSPEQLNCQALSKEQQEVLYNVPLDVQLVGSGFLAKTHPDFSITGREDIHELYQTIYTNNNARQQRNTNLMREWAVLLGALETNQPRVIIAYGAGHDFSEAAKCFPEMLIERVKFKKKPALWAKWMVEAENNRKDYPFHGDCTQLEKDARAFLKLPKPIKLDQAAFYLLIAGFVLYATVCYLKPTAPRKAAMADSCNPSPE